MTTASRRRALIACLAFWLGSAAIAGGPLYTYDPANRIPYAWNMASWPNGLVPIYTDLGSLGPLTNEQARSLVVNAAWEWSSVPTSSFRAVVAGDFASLGLGDITSANIGSIIGTFNGGGIHVVYDDDGSILSNYFGVPPTSVLGITDIEDVAADSAEVLEAYMVLSGPGVRLDDPNGTGFAGVVTHEMGHALNLAHSQANGATLPSTDLDPPQPPGCGAPWTGAPNDTQCETMYPFITPEPGATGEFMASVHQLDDKAALSDIYPALGWPQATGTIRGQILDSSGNPVIGINVIARNVADPFHDCTSYISGQVSKGDAGPDGSFVINGLTPGAGYVLYVDQLTSGAFSVPTPIVLPGPEEYFNGAMESANGATDDRCAWSPVVVTAGAPVSIAIAFDHIPGAPTFITAPDLSVSTVPTDITPDGSVVVGGAGLDGSPVFRWDLNSGAFDILGGIMLGNVGISDDGLKITANVVDPIDGVNKAAIYENDTWTVLPSVPGAVACDHGDGNGPMKTIAYDISGDGSTVVGLSYGSQGCNDPTIRGFKWTAAGGTVALPKIDAFSRLNRADKVNYDGSVIVGRDDANSGQLRGFQWRNGVYSLIKRNGLSVGEALSVSRDGKYIVGQGNSLATNNNPWLWSQSSPSTVQLLGAVLGQDSALAAALDDDASVITGHSLDYDSGTITPTIWTRGMGLADFNQFLGAQGVNTSGLGMRLGMAMSADGRTITGYANAPNGYLGWVLQTPTSVVCHTPPESPSQLQTLVVSFPQGLNAALASGDTLGPCQCSGSVPTGISQLTVEKPTAGTAHLDWSAVTAAGGYDLVRGSLAILASSHGDFSAATTGCLENDSPDTSWDDADTPNPGDGFWYLVRAVNCAGSGTFDSGDPSQVASRDAGIQASPEAYP